MIEVKEIKLSLRYPNSKQEDITDAFMRGYTNAVDATKKAIERLEKDNDKLLTDLEAANHTSLMFSEWLNKSNAEKDDLRVLVQDMWTILQFSFEKLGVTNIEVNGKLLNDSLLKRMKELGIEVTNEQ